MGVTGLWKLIDASGKPVPLETLENKVLAIDISIWLHQVVKGFQDHQGATLPNAHLLGLFHRLCKLLFYKIKPVFVFDGGCPALKRETIAKRSQAKNKYQQEADRLQQLLLENLAKEKVVQKALGVNAGFLISPKKAILEATAHSSKDDLFKLPPVEDVPATVTSNASSSADESDDTPTKTPHNFNLHTIDVKSDYFKNLPADIRHEILTDLKETRKQSSWGRLHELPAESKKFSSFQMLRLLKRRQVQVSLEEAEQEMGGKCLSLAELESLLNEEGFETEAATKGGHIASDENTRYLLVKDIKAVMESGKMSSEAPKKLETVTKGEKDKVEMEASVLGQEYDLDLQQAIQLSLVAHETDGDGCPLSMDEIAMSTQQQRKMANSELACARDYMLEFGGMSTDNIKELLTKRPEKNKNDSEDAAADSDATQYYYNEKDIVKGDEATKEKPLESQTPDKTEVLVDVSSGSDSDSDFVDVPDDALPEVDGLPKLPVLPIRKDYLVDGTPSKDFRLEDLKAVKPGMEIVIKPDLAPMKDDLFADIFDQAPNADPVTPEKQVTPVSPGSIIELSDGEDDVKHKKQAALDRFLQQNTPNKTPTKSASVEENVPKVASPFFVQRSPSKKSTEKAVKETTAETERLGEKVAKSLFGDVVEKTVTTEDVFEAAADKLKADTTHDDLVEMAEQLKSKKVDLLAEKNKQSRMGVSITEQMSKDCMELLRLFGVPYVVAPMEAESQCAFLNAINLTDGTITDDSDIWLFGGKRVYKNFFNQKKLVMEYEVDNIERLFQMDRKKMIQLAMLVGSDYTTGIHGIGAVTALEILATFPATPESEGTNESMSILSGLRKFREWLVNGKNASTTSRATLKSKLKNIEVTEGFPSYNIVEAYLHPAIDSDAEPFSWGLPDAEELYEFSKQTFGWTKSRTDDILLPVLRKLNEKKNQQAITNYFKVQSITANSDLALSKRVKKAVDIMAGKIDPNEEVKGKGKRKAKTKEAEEDEEEKLKPKRKARGKQAQAESVADGATDEPMPSTSNDDIVDLDMFEDPMAGEVDQNKEVKARGKRKAKAKEEVADEEGKSKPKRKARAKQESEVKESTNEPIPNTSIPEDPITQKANPNEGKMEKSKPTRNEPAAEEPIIEPTPSTSNTDVVDIGIFEDPIVMPACDSNLDEEFVKPAKPRGRKPMPQEKPQTIGGISRVIKGINVKSAIAMGGKLLPPKRANRTPIIPNPSPRIPQKELVKQKLESDRQKAIEKFKSAKKH